MKYDLLNVTKEIKSMDYLDYPDEEQRPELEGYIYVAHEDTLVRYKIQKTSNGQVECKA